MMNSALYAKLREHGLMDTGKRQHLQDIYSSDRTKSDDFTPQVSNKATGGHQRDIRRNNASSFMLGAVILVIALGLVWIIVSEYLDILNQASAPPPITQEYIPRYSLETESQWVLDFSRSYGNPKWDGEGDRPMNSAWLKKATFNLILAEQALGLGEFEEATKYYEDALTILPNLEGVKVPLGMAYFKLDQFDKALDLLEGAPDIDLTFDVLNNLGAACIKAEKFDQAEDYLKRSLEEKPAYAEATRNLALLYKQMDRHDEAAAAFEQYLDKRPLDTDTRYDFALYLTKIGTWELAGEQLRTLTEEVTDVANLYVLLARVETKLGNDKAAIDAFQRATQLSDPKQALLWMNENEFDQLRNHDDFQALIKYNKKK